MCVVKFSTGNAAGNSAVHVPHRPAVAATQAMQITAKAKKLTFGGQDYAVIVTRNLFRPTGASAMAATVFTPTSTTIAPFQPQSDNASQPQLAFTGIVEISGEKYALLESLGDHLAQYTRLGSTAFGYKLVGIADNAVTLEADGETTVLNIGDNKVEEQTTKPTTTDQQNTTSPTDVNNPGAGSPNGTLPGPNSGGGYPYRQRQIARSTDGGRIGKCISNYGLLAL